jgi:hypothetical protein
MAATPLRGVVLARTPPTADPGAPGGSAPRDDHGGLFVSGGARPDKAAKPAAASEDVAPRALTFAPTPEGAVMPWLAPLVTNEGQPGIAVNATTAAALGEVACSVRVVSVFGKAR